MFDSLDRVGGGLVNIILGALILWVGQTTFHHAGQLATVDEKFENVSKQFSDVDQRYDSMKSWLDKVVTSMKDSNRSNFTKEDADKLTEQLRKLDVFASNVERRLTDRLTDVEVKMAALESRQETRYQSSHEVAELQMEVAQLRTALAQPMAPPQAAQYQTAERTVGSAPVYLPPVDVRR
jgi:chromosome segregation ATPase